MIKLNIYLSLNSEKERDKQMKKLLTKILSMAIVFVMVMCLVPPMEAKAASKPEFSTTHYLRYYPKDKASNKNSYYFGDWGKNYKIASIKSSNPKVATLSKTYKDKSTFLILTTKKAGTTTITFKAKIGSKYQKYKTKVTVTKYTSPLKSFKIGGTNLTSRSNKVDVFNLGGKKTVKGKLALKLNKNWEITSVNFVNANNKWKWNMNKKGTVTLKKNCQLFINCRNKKTGARETIDVRNYKQY